MQNMPLKGENIFNRHHCPLREAGELLGTMNLKRTLLQIGEYIEKTLRLFLKLTLIARQAKLNKQRMFFHYAQPKFDLRHG
jgi:hypothetical protein